MNGRLVSAGTRRTCLRLALAAILVMTAGALLGVVLAFFGQFGPGGWPPGWLPAALVNLGLLCGVSAVAVSGPLGRRGRTGAKARSRRRSATSRPPAPKPRASRPRPRVPRPRAPRPAAPWAAAPRPAGPGLLPSEALPPRRNYKPGEWMGAPYEPPPSRTR